MLELDSVLFVGGVPKDMYSSLPVGVLSRQGFEGCMSSLDLPGESPSLMDDAVVPSSSLGSGCEGTSNELLIYEFGSIELLLIISNCFRPYKMYAQCLR